MDNNYFLYTKTADKWQKLGIERRAGIAVPLFSIYSSSSCGIGDFNVLKLLIDWCEKCGFSILQLLPLNDVGSDFAPYSSVSTFAIDPMYLSFDMLAPNENEYIKDISLIRKKFRPRFGRVNYGIKRAKIKLAGKIYGQHNENDLPELQEYIVQNSYWLKDYALFKILKRIHNNVSWEKFSDEYRYRDNDSLIKLEEDHKEEINFICWLQWKLSLQLKYVKEYAESKKIYIMGDLPFLVSRDSADVWTNQNYFRLDLASGAPPDMYFALGQKWGMPPYNWDNIAGDGFNYIKQRLGYAENFYHMFRIDHFVGLFRVWTSSYKEISPGPTGGSYLPKDEYLWEEHGRRIIDIMSCTSMLPCAEDLGTVPDCSYKVLYEYGIPGIDFQRYMKSDYYFRHPSEYRINSSTVISTHDSTFFINWWKYEAGTIDEKLFELMFFAQSDNKEHFIYAKNTLFDLERSMHGRLRWNENISSVEIMLSVLQPRQDKIYEFINLYMDSFGEKIKFAEYLGTDCSSPVEVIINCSLKKANESRSIFSIQLLHEYLCLDKLILDKTGRWNFRINTPGKVSRYNWSQLLPVSIETLISSNLDIKINTMLKETGRLLVH